MSVARAVRSSSIAELAWTDPDGAPDGCGVLALVWDETPVVAFTYAYEPIARAAAASPVVSLTLTDTRSTDPAFSPACLLGRPRLVEDVGGELFTEDLLAEELRRYPPARKFADSAMLQREHWWYLPRLVLALDVIAMDPLPPRAAPDEHVLVVATGTDLEVAVARADPAPGADGPSLVVQPVAEAALTPGRAALIGQNASFPDLERWSSWCFRGRFDGSGLRLTQPPPTVGLPGVPSIWQRAMAQRRLGRACRAGIRRAERDRGWGSTR